MRDDSDELYSCIQFSYVNYSENPVRKKIATAKVEVYVHSQTKGRYRQQHSIGKTIHIHYLQNAF